ncbi:het-s domain protein [Colletotrichum chrysophilum]|uniref:Het-s domain protein n=1 Tax=Colletotrichum chrysophilum TaxID=1836956 RepID=A0AAD9AXS6_9PEZI|nr:het-s domain protein [Colletotrichum chrysophilum]
MSVELLLAAVSAADLCLKYGTTLIEAYRDLRGADEAVQSKTLIVEAIWNKTAIQVEFVKRIAKVLEEDHCRIHLEVLEVLKSKLILAISKIKSVVKTGPNPSVKRWKYTRVREAIDDSIAQLQQWQKIFDPTWYLILRVGNRLIDDELSRPGVADFGHSSSSTASEHTKANTTLTSAQSIRNVVRGNGSNELHVTLPEGGLDWTNTRKIKYSSTVLVHRKASEKVYAVDTITCDASYNLPRLKADTEDLAKKLKREDIDAFGFLPCKGVIKQKSPETRKLASMSLAFQLPYIDTSKAPVSLREYLLQDRRFSLSRVVEIAKQLARAVSFIHTFDFVHKNIRPETILVFPDHESKRSSELGLAYLLGFDSFRNVNFHTLRAGDDAWERNLYRHPTRQGLQAQETYIMQHDVYSLGVCLLELGLWDSFVEYNSDAGETSSKTAPGMELGLSLADFKFQSGNIEQTQKIKNQLVSLAKARVPARMGDKYASVVITCLTCLDEDSDDFDGDNMQDEDGILVGVRFIEKVLMKLGEISL